MNDWVYDRVDVQKKTRKKFDDFFLVFLIWVTFLRSQLPHSTLMALN